MPGKAITRKQVIDALKAILMTWATFVSENEEAELAAIDKQR